MDIAFHNICSAFHGKNPGCCQKKISCSRTTTLFLFLRPSFFHFCNTFLPDKKYAISCDVNRYPPICKILYAFSISLFGINEFAVRIPQLLFAVFTSILIFRICEFSLNSKETGLISACCYAFSPMVFYYSSLGEIICGAVFFVVIVIYFYLSIYRQTVSNTCSYRFI